MRNFRFIFALFVLSLAPLSARAMELVLVEQAGCEWCEVWDEEIGLTYHRSAEGRVAPLRRVDIHDALPGDLTFIRGLVYTPTFVLVHEGREVGRILGYPGEDFFWGLLEQLIKRIPENARSKAHTGPLPKPPSRDTKRPALRG